MLSSRFFYLMQRKNFRLMNMGNVYLMILIAACVVHKVGDTMTYLLSPRKVEYL